MRGLDSEQLQVILTSARSRLTPGVGHGFNTALMARKDSSATLTYHELQLGSPSGDSLWPLKIVAGAGTMLYNPATTISANTFYTLKLNISGSTLQLFKDAAQVGTDQTDTVSSGLRCALVVQGNNASTNSGGFEDFEASDGQASNSGAAWLHYSRLMNSCLTTGLIR